MQSTLPTAPIPAQQGGGPTDPSHDDLLRRGVIATEVSRPVAWLLTALFIAAIFVVPLSQTYIEHTEEEESPLFDLFRRAPTAENLRQVEKSIEEAAYVKAWVQPRAQLALTTFGRVGNKLAVVGREGWLYYTPGVLHVGGPGFLEPAVQQAREREALDADAEDPLHADPMPAILEFQRALAARGIHLVLLPMPDKAGLEPGQLAGGRGRDVWAFNADHDRFLDALQRAGVSVLDARKSVPESTDEPLYLIQDTHYTPAFMERIARDLAKLVQSAGNLPPLQPAPFHAVEQRVERVGDLVDMLKLTEDQDHFLPQSVLIHQVQDVNGDAWEPKATGDVLLLGDSFTNIFSLEGMGWGAAAGLGAQLALALQRPVDVIAQNDSGAFATRQALSRELAAGEDRLAGKRVVIWEFAARELSLGNWKPFTFPTPPSKPPAEAR
jgi:SGNH hydrolase-like domain, acetyltransferase AlgX